MMEVLHSCRCCLRRPPDRALTTPYTHLGHTEIYSNMLEECFDLHVNTLTLGVDNECGICEVCVGRLRDASDFKLQVQRNQVELQAQFVKILQVKEEELVQDSEMEDENRTSEQPVSCEEPPIKREMEENDGTSSEEGRDILHEERAIKPETLGGAPSEDCVLPGVKAELACPLSPRARQQLAMVCSVRLERLPSPVTREAASHSAGLRARKLYTCDICGQQFNKLYNKSRHVKQKHEGQKNLKKEVICNICNKTLKPDSMNAHKLIHTGEKAHVCDICDKRFTQKATLNTHKLQHTGARPYSCKICKKTFTRSHSVRKHERSHAKLKPYSCDECHKTFSELEYMRQHKSIVHSSEAPYACDQCGARFKRRHALTLHLEMHTGKKRFSCGICDHQCSYRNDLRRHQLIHTENKAYACDLCQKKFIRQIDLRKHRALHTENLESHLIVNPYIPQKIYTCDICKRQFIKRSSLITHIKLHMGQRDYPCKICYKKFASSSSLKKHEIIHSGGKPHTCDICNKKFLRKWSLRRHIESHKG